MLVGGGAARADSATCQIPIIHATPGGGGDQSIPEIDMLKPYLVEGAVHRVARASSYSIARR